MNRWSTRAALGRTITPAYLVGAGLVAGVTALVEAPSAPRFVGGSTVGGYLEFLMLAVPAVGLVYAGYWLHVGDFDPDSVWRIGAFALGGTIIAAALTVVLLRFGPVPPLEAGAALVLFVGTGTEGSPLGVLAGTFAVTDRRFRREHDLADELGTLQALVRHDVRNRLTIIGGHLTLATEAAEVPADAVATIEAQLEAIESLLADVEQATRALRGEGAAERVNLVALVHDQIDLLGESYDEVSVRTDLPEAAWVIGDDLLSSVLANLLTNAVSHHDRSDPEIDVRATVGDDTVRLSLADDGPGIPSGRRDAVFEPGVGDGTGMGLYLVETIVERYGGSVRVDDNEPRGTVVTVTLPRADA